MQAAPAVRELPVAQTLPASLDLEGMRERADAIGARLDIEPEPFVGTFVDCQVNR